MTKKADFNAEEWETVVEAPVFAGLLVIASDRGGTIRESLAMGRVYQEARQRTPRRWTRSTRNWNPVGPVALNPDREAVLATRRPAQPI